MFSSDTNPPIWQKPEKNAQSPSDLWTLLTWHVLELVPWTWKSWFSLTNYPLEPSTIPYTHDYQPSFSRQGPDSRGRLNASFSNNALKAVYNSIKHFTHEGQSQFHSVGEKKKNRASVPRHIKNAYCILKEELYSASGVENPHVTGNNINTRSGKTADWPDQNRMRPGGMSTLIFPELLQKRIKWRAILLELKQSVGANGKL